MFMFIAAAVILAAVTGGVVAAIRRSHNQACIDKRLRMYCSRSHFGSRRSRVIPIPPATSFYGGT